MKYRTLMAVFLALCLSVLTACSSGPKMTGNSLSYDDIKGSGLANLCPQLDARHLDSIAVQTNQAYQLREFCLQPETFLVRRLSPVKGREEQFIPTKLLTRATTSLDQIWGSLQADAKGNLMFREKGGMDFQPLTVQLPDGERVPMLFTIKGLVATAQNASAKLNPATKLAGTFQIPPYRSVDFIDPKGRGAMMGYEAAVGLPIQADDAEFIRQNQKAVEVVQGNISLQINRVNRRTGEIAGLFESEQPSDTEFGAKEPMAVKIQGQFYGRVEQELALTIGEQAA